MVPVPPVTPRTCPTGRDWTSSPRTPLRPTVSGSTGRDWTSSPLTPLCPTVSGSTGRDRTPSSPRVTPTPRVVFDGETREVQRRPLGQAGVGLLFTGPSRPVRGGVQGRGRRTWSVPTRDTTCFWGRDWVPMRPLGPVAPPPRPLLTGLVPVSRLEDGLPTPEGVRKVSTPFDSEKKTSTPFDSETPDNSPTQV